MKCTICGRRGLRSATMVHAPDANGTLRRVRACGTCARTGITIVPLGGATKCACGSPAVKCETCTSKREARETAKVLAPFVAKLRGLARAYRARATERNEGSTHALGLEQAADLLENGEL